MNMDPKAYKTLEDVWAAIPRIDCRKRCAGSCTVIPLHRVELVKLRTRAPKVETRVFNGAPEVSVLAITPDGDCPLLLFNQCTVYEVRPLICRLYGVAAGMPCVHGCKPARALERDEVTVLMEAVHLIGGGRATE
jgi:hypothetical protein